VITPPGAQAWRGAANRNTPEAAGLRMFQTGSGREETGWGTWILSRFSATSGKSRNLLKLRERLIIFSTFQEANWTMVKINY